MFPINQNYHPQVADNMGALKAFPVEIAKGVIKIKKSALYLIIVLSILSVLSGARLMTLDYSTGAKAFDNDMDRARSSETVDFSDNSLDENSFAVQYAEPSQ